VGQYGGVVMLKRFAVKPAVLGGLCLLVAITLAWFSPPEMKAGVSSEESGQQVTNPYPRELDAREVPTKNTREEFEAARKRGLTEAEVREVVEEFHSYNIHSLKPEDLPPENLKMLWESENRWYLDTLMTGFGMSDLQKSEVARKLSEMRARDLRDYQEYLTKKQIPDLQKIQNAIDHFLVISDFLYEYKLLKRQEYAPWNLCDLTQLQKEMIGYLPLEGGFDWLPGRLPSDVSLTEEELEIWDHWYGRGWNDVPDAGKLFPLSMGQMKRVVELHQAGIALHSGEVKTFPDLEQAKILTAYQLRIHLLLNPNSGVDLLEEIGGGK
jgi:hypothetical protein